MQKKVKNYAKLLVIIFFISIYFNILPTYAWQFSGEVVQVYDGDTLSIKEKVNEKIHLVRISSIDAPELGQVFGIESRNYLYNLTFGKNADANCYRTLKDFVEVCSVTVNGKDVAIELLEKGMVWRYRLYIEGQHPKKRYPYEYAEKGAIKEGLGLWGNKNKEPPWKWREKLEDWTYYWEWYWHDDW